MHQVELEMQDHELRRVQEALHTEPEPAERFRLVRYFSLTSLVGVSDARGRAV